MLGSRLFLRYTAEAASSGKDTKRLEPEQSKETMSRVLLEYAHDYIGMGSTLEQKQTYLDASVMAWNLSLFPEAEREEHMQAGMKELEACNPGSKNVSILRHSLPILIERRLMHFATFNRLIVRAELSVVDGKECLNVASTDFGQEDQ